MNSAPFPDKESIPVHEDSTFVDQYVPLTPKQIEARARQKVKDDAYELPDPLDEILASLQIKR